MKRIVCSLLITISLVACGDDAVEPLQCADVTASQFTEQSGWEPANYCSEYTSIGCYPFFADSQDTCGEFLSLRTAETPAGNVTACESLLTEINCKTYSNADGDSLEVVVTDPDRLKMKARGSLGGNSFDQSWFFNPCQPNCFAAITLQTIDSKQQTLCDIPRTGKIECLFPETAHNITFQVANKDFMVIALGGKTYQLDAQ